MAERRLSAEERALWKRVSSSVRRDGADMPPEPTTALPNRPVSAVRSTPSLQAGRVARPGTTLDASWDRRIATGRAGPDRVIDLHGCSLATAHDRLDRELGAAIVAGVRVLLIVTGRPPPPGSDRTRVPVRGVIRASISDWLGASRHASQIAAVRPAHALHGGAGALYVILRRKR